MTTSGAHSTVGIPVFGAIVSIVPILDYIQRHSPLDVVARVIGREDLVEMMFIMCISEDGDVKEDLESIFFDEQLERLKEKNVDFEELHYEMSMLHTYIYGAFLGRLNVRLQENLNEYGCHISKWLSPDQVIVDSGNTVVYSRESRRSIFRDKEFSSMGSDRRLIGHNQVLRNRAGIESFDVPY